MSLWAIDGHSAQLTSRNPDMQQGYISGTCIKIDEEAKLIAFETSALHQNSKRSEVLQLDLKEIGRYDTNWWE